MTLKGTIKVLKGSIKALLGEKFVSYIIYFINQYPCLEEYLVDQKKKIIYVIIPKVACSSIKKTFIQKEFKDHHAIHKIALTGPLSIKTNSKICWKDDYYVFTFVRNPFDRLYSFYKDKFIIQPKQLKSPAFIHYLFGYLAKDYSDRDCTFETIVRKISRLPDFLSDTHFISQSYILKNASINFIGRFEHLKEDFEPIKVKYKLGELSHFNKTQDQTDEWKNHYTKELVDIVYKRYKKDFDMWYPDAYTELMDYLEKKGEAKEHFN